MRILAAMVFALLFVGGFFPSAAKALETKLRRPVALAASEDGRWLYVANRESGSLSVIDIQKRSVASEVTIGGRLSDLIKVDDRLLLALDEQQHELILLTGEAAEWKASARLSVAPYPVRLQWASETGRCYVTSLWSKTVSLVEVSRDEANSPRLTPTKTVELPFEPREMCLVQEGKHLIVADAFGGMLAVMEAESLKPIAQKTIPGHNIRGLAPSADGKWLLVAQQEINPLARSTEDDVHWGNMLMNLVVSLSLPDLLNPKPEGKIQHTTRELGEPGRGAGDPGAIHIDAEGRMAIALSGVNELALAHEDGLSFQRIPVGRRPVAMASTNDGRLFVANMFSDSISIIDPIRPGPSAEISLGDRPELRAEEIGEMLFFDSRLSLEGWMSCHSCHTDGHSNGQLNDNLSDGAFGTPKRVLSLLGVGETGPWAWNGEMKTLKQQIASSIEKTMQGEKPSEDNVDALAAFLEALPAPPAPKEEENSSEIGLGRELFQALDCRRCHSPPVYTTPKVYDVGLKDSLGHRQFNPPSLRGVGRRPTLFHDGSASSLEDVFLKHKHQLGRDLSKEELERLMRFLRSL
jgi:YVTN family beta-propeller protein